MLDYPKINEVIEAVAKAKLGRKNVVRTFTEPWSDSDGKDALRITIVISEGAVDRLRGDKLGDNLLEIHNQLYQMQDARTPIVEYATEEELAAGDDPEC